MWLIENKDRTNSDPYGIYWYIFHQNYDKNCETGYGVNGLSDYTAEWMMRNYYIPEGPPSSHSMWTPCEKGRQHRVYVNM